MAMLLRVARLGFCAFVLFAGCGPIGDDTPMPSDEQMLAVARAHRAALADLVHLLGEAPSVGSIDLLDQRFAVEGPHRRSSYWRPSTAMTPSRWRRFEADLRALGAWTLDRDDFGMTVPVWYGTGINAPRRGYVYTTKHPRPILASTTNEKDPLWYRYTYLYRRIGDGWYIWFDTSS
jgi:hypothetical protein